MDENQVYLVQSDTTVGFLSNDDKKLSDIKKRSSAQKILQVIDSFSTLKLHTRVPNKYKKLVRNTNKTTFIYPTKESFRVVPENLHHNQFVSKFKKMYSTSANETTKEFDFEYAYSQADVIVFEDNNFYEANSSKIFKISKCKIQKIR
jgi:tRNA A37 threonylcarbamoyladenosine synthetase subunit TsaC/SUA5/YrdC